MIDRSSSNGQDSMRKGFLYICYACKEFQQAHSPSMARFFVRFNLTLQPPAAYLVHHPWASVDIGFLWLEIKSKITEPVRCEI